ncbi:MAG: AmmeMemoRadiSam system protein B [Syntrophobacteraceae bacterium]|nr:AmmeMemoRadiSam system protein B [Syntrophobacteraceae bacterium]
METVGDRPKLRYGLEAFPIVHGGRRMILVRDLLGFCDDPLLFSPPMAELLLLMNGENSLRDLQTEYMRMTGNLLFVEHLEAVVKELDQRLFLENERFTQAAAERVARFRQDPVRRMQHAGKSYAEDPDALRAQLDAYFEPDNGGPGFPGIPQNDRPVVGLVAPHIDLRAGGRCFAHAYKAACEGRTPATWVILGTGHEPIENSIALTAKDFETPLGIVRCARDYCRELSARVSRDLTAGEYSHHREHSVEFQAVFLAHTQPDVRVVPILCSFSLENWDEEKTFIDEAAEAMRDLARNSLEPVGFLAGVDFAHVGPRYGDRFSPGAGDIREHLAEDRILLEILERCDSREFIERIRRDDNRRRICGLAPLYVLAKILEGWAEGRTLQQGHAVVDPQNSFVTFAGMVFYGKA